MKIGTVEVELKPKDIEEIKNKIKEDLINEGYVKVVRCKDCIHCADDYINTGMGCRPEFTCELGGINDSDSVDPNDYCSYGEREE